ncbi:hypothetical protein IAT40_005919 [Kwoniella sp. CBS 6097]
MSSSPSTASKQPRLGIPPPSLTSSSSNPSSELLTASSSPSTSSSASSPQPFVSKIRPPTGGCVISRPALIKPHPRTSSLASKHPTPVRTIPTLISAHRKAATSTSGGGTITKRPTLRRTQVNKVVAPGLDRGSKLNMRKQDTATGSNSNMIDFPQPRVSFLTPREVWSPLATPIPGMPSASSSSSARGESEIPSATKMRTAPRTSIPKYQLRDPGVTPTSSDIPKPKSKPRPTSQQPATTGLLTSSIPKPRPASQPLAPVTPKSTLKNVSRVASAIARRPPGIGTMIRNRAAASPPSQGEKLATSLLPRHQPANRPSKLPTPSSTPAVRVPSYGHSRHLSEPASTIQPFIDRPRPVSWTQEQTPSLSSRDIGSDGGDMFRHNGGMLEAPLLDARMGSNASNASSASNCSSASSLARHRAIRAKGRGRPRSKLTAKVGDAIKPTEEGGDRRLADMDVEEFDESSLEGTMEDYETGSTISEVSIRTAATVNVPNTDANPTSADPQLASPYELLAPYEYARSSYSPSLNSVQKEWPASHIPNHLDTDNTENIEDAEDSEDTENGEETHDSMCAPYLVPAAGPRMTLEWESDGAANSEGEIDEAERVWRELENKLGRKVRGTSIRRGRWVVRPVREDLIGTEIGEDHAGSARMEKTPSDFSISYYVSQGKPTPSHVHAGENREASQAYSDAYDNDNGHYDYNDDRDSISPISSDADTHATALFDMSAPLIPSATTSACTPWNTPAMNNETLRRSRRVKKKGSESASLSAGMSMGMSRLNSSASGECEQEPKEEDDVVGFYQETGPCESPIDRSHTISAPSPASILRSDEEFTPFPKPHIKSSPTQNQRRPQPTNEDPRQPIPRPGPVYRLDSHVVSALSALKGAFDSPELDQALTASLYRSFTLDSMDDISEISEDNRNDDEGREEENAGILGGLGLGVPLNLDSVYHLPVLSPRLRPSSIARASKQTQKFEESSSPLDLEITEKKRDLDNDAGLVDSPIEMSVEGSPIIAVGDSTLILNLEAKKGIQISRLEANDNEAGFKTDEKQEQVEVKADVEEMIVIRDLDTGLAREVRVDSLVHDLALR